MSLTVAESVRPSAPALDAPVSIVVPVHGHAELTRRCLDAVLAELPAGCELIVVDDASPDGTAELLTGYAGAIEVLHLAENVGYARACNHGAAVATHDALVFLNNDTEPRTGWLRALSAYMQAHPAADVVGAKLVYPTGAVQHAGVAIGQDGYPHNLYAGFPGEHPAVSRSRSLQAVTGACMLVRRRAFEQADGFDTGYENSLEDIDLCLRIREGGGEVHYCHQAVVVHLESASRGREQRFERSVARWRARWRDRVHRDDLAIYAADGLIGVEYREAYPQRLSISPLVAVVDSGREREIESLLDAYATQTSGLLAEVMRLTGMLGAPAARATSAPVAGGNAARCAEPAARTERPARAVDHRAFLAEASRLEEGARRLQERAASGGRRVGGAQNPFSPNRRLGYRRLGDRVCAAIADAVPAGAAVLVVSHGDRELLRVAERDARHFPQDRSGGYLGHHPADSADAIARLERLREAGAEYLILPSVSYWWREHYRGFAEHLRRHYPASDLGVCAVYRLDRRRPARAVAEAEA